MPGILALLALGLLGVSVALPHLPYQDGERLADVVRLDLSAGANAHDQLSLAEAEAHYRSAVRAIESARAAATYDRDLHATSLVRLGHVLEDEGNFREAERCYREALALYEAEGNAYSERPVQALSRLGELYVSIGEEEQAKACRSEIDSIVARVEPIHLRAIALQRDADHADPRLLADKLMELADLYDAQGSAAKAASLYEEVFAIRHTRAKGSDAEVLAPLVAMGIAKTDVDQNDAAAEILRETLALREGRYGSTSPRLVANLHNLGVLAYRQGRLKEADSLFTRSLAIVERTLGSDAYYATPILTALAQCALERERYASASAYQTRVVRISRRVFGDETSQVGTALLALAEIEAAAGDYDRARDVCGEALDELMRTVGPVDPVTLECENTLLRLTRWIG